MNEVVYPGPDGSAGQFSGGWLDRVRHTENGSETTSE